MKLIYKGKEIDISEGETIKEVLKEEITKEIITCNFNNEIKSLNHKPKQSGKVELLDYTTTEGKRRKVALASLAMVHGLYPTL